MGATRLVQECERLAGWHRIDLTPAKVAAEPGALDKYGLTPREVEVLRLLTRGLSNKQIAERLVISPKTVGNHVEHIYTKIDASTRAAASLFAMQHGLLPEEEFPEPVAV